MTQRVSDERLAYLCEAIGKFRERLDPREALDTMRDLRDARTRIAELEEAVKKLATGMASMAMDVSELETREARWKTLVKYVAEGTWQCKSASVKPKWWDKQLMERCDRFLEAMLEGEDA